MKRSNFTKHVVALLLLAGLSSAVWVHRVHVDRPDRHGFADLDMVHYYYPTAVFLHRELQGGNLPLWNPYQFAGQPFLALHVPAVLYPPNLFLFGLLRPARALQAHAVLHLLIAGFFTWLFAARLGLGAPARFTAAIVYMLSGPLLYGIYTIDYLSTEAWLPAILWAVHGLLSTARTRWATGLAVFLSLAFLGGHAQGFLYMVQFAFAYGVFGLVFLTPDKTRWRVIGLGALSGLIALGLVGPQLLPALELTQEAIRSFDGHPFRQAAFPSVSPSLLLEGLLGQLGTYIFGASSVDFGPGWPEMRFPPPLQWQVALPVLALPLIACGPMARRHRAHWVFLVCAAVLSGLFVLGPVTSVFRMYYELPFGNLFRGPMRMDFLYVFLIAILSAIGIQGVVERLRSSRAGALGARAVVTFVVLAIATDSYTRTELVLTHPILSAPSGGGPPELIRFMQAQPNRERIFIEQGRGWVPSLVAKVGMMNRIFAVPDYEPTMPAVYEQYFKPPTHLQPWHGQVTVLTTAIFKPASGFAKLLDLMSVRYYAVKRPIRADQLGQLQRFADGKRLSLGRLEVIERPSALPRAYVVHRTLYEPDIEVALARMKTDSFRPAHEALVTEREAARRSMQTPPNSGNLSPTKGTDRATIISYSTEEVVVEAECDSDCFLVLTDLHYPGWRAYVDGRETKVYRANVLFRGVLLDPGGHRVVYRFDPRTFRLGLFMLGGSLLAMAGQLAYSGRHRIRVKAS